MLGWAVLVAGGVPREERRNETHSFGSTCRGCRKRVEMERDQENAANLASCLTRAKSVNDSKLEGTCREMFEKK